MQLNTLHSSSGVRQARRIGRGGKRGKTSGRGTKGQKARAGRKLKPAERDTIKRIPKRRGYGKNRARTVDGSAPRPAVVNVSDLERTFSAGARIDPRSLLAAGLVRPARGRAPAVKILGTGTITKSFSVVGCDLSARARDAVQHAGGSVVE